MNRPEFKAACAIALNGEDLTGENIDPFDGYGLKGFEPVYVTLRQVARLIRWQALPIMVPKGSQPSLDNEQLEGIAKVGRHKFIII